ncbi:hypothetical protein WH47_01980 [Habropoda laboriosa]|uniref:Uncharacterized protein n=1 Tax=Habropoda laboriosa TaxID=597456 RepID=A0A0L7R0A8_9HYME|nr:hypothetical protein WH47_01980 [Habropoda laboriosa]
MQWSLRLTSCVSLNNEDLTSKLLNNYHAIVSEYETLGSSYYRKNLILGPPPVHQLIRNDKTEKPPTVSVSSAPTFSPVLRPEDGHRGMDSPHSQTGHVVAFLAVTGCCADRNDALTDRKDRYNEALKAAVRGHAQQCTLNRSRVVANNLHKRKTTLDEHIACTFHDTQTRKLFLKKSLYSLIPQPNG